MRCDLKRFYEIIRTLVFACILLYVVGVFAFQALRLTMGDSTWWMGFLNTFARWVFAPAFLLLPLALLPLLSPAGTPITYSWLGLMPRDRASQTLQWTLRAAGARP